MGELHDHRQRALVDPNYTISYVTGTLTVTPAALTITADNQTKALRRGCPRLTASYSGFVNGDTAASLTARPRLHDGHGGKPVPWAATRSPPAARVRRELHVQLRHRHADGDAGRA